MRKLETAQYCLDRAGPGDSTRIAKVWVLRHAGRVADAFDRYLDMAADQGVDLTGPAAARIKALMDSGWTAGEAVDFLLLGPSFERHRGLTAAAEAGFAELAAAAHAFGVHQHFQLCFQKGLMLMAVADYGAALTNFYRAKRLARSPIEANYSAINQILCLENLGYEFTPLLGEFCGAFAPYEGEEWAQGIVGQMYALKARSALRHGDMTALVDLAPKAAASVQTSYLIAFGVKLPYFRSASLGAVQPAAPLTAQPAAYQAQFRLRTLSFVLVDEDLAGEKRLGDKIERLYLWVWLWLLAPTTPKLERILRLTEHVLGAAVSGQITAEEALQLENALSWLCLFAGGSAAIVQRLMAGLQPTAEQTLPILAYEARLLHLFFALRDGRGLAEDTRDDLARAGDSTGAHCLLPELLRATTTNAGQPLASELATVGKALQSLLDSGGPRQGQGQDQEGIRVDMLARRVLTMTQSGGPKSLTSDGLCLLLYSFAERSAVPLGEVLQSCFAIRAYDPVIHDPKVANLILRANRECTPFLRFSRKGGMIFMERQAAGPVIFERASEHVVQLYGKLDRLACAAAARERSESSAADRPDEGALSRAQVFMAGPEWKTRKDFEILLAQSRSSVGRTLNALVAQGLVERRGSGKATSYKPQAEFLRQLRRKEGTAHDAAP